MYDHDPTDLCSCLRCPNLFLKSSTHFIDGYLASQNIETETLASKSVSVFKN